jgi:outer membrane protein OmpA-like peptidoglycan-associated protein
MSIQNFSPRVASRAALHVAAALTFVFGAVAAQAQTVMVYEEGQAPSAQDIADILSRGASENTKLRGLPTQNGRSPFALLEQTPTKTVNEASAVSVPVHFEFDSAVLSPKAKEQLDVIAEGIRLTEGTIKVVVEGHTDAKGSVHYNESLSYRRAASVRAYLVSSKKLPVTLLTVEGKGPHKLLNKADFDTATAIQSVVSKTTTEKSGIYTLTGARVAEGNSTEGLTKGIYIINGKKVVVR